MDTQTKKIILIGAGIACLLLAYFGSQSLQIDWLGNVAGGLHALNFAINIAKF